MKRWFLLVTMFVFAFSLSACQDSGVEEHEEETLSSTVLLSGEWLGFGYDVSSSDTGTTVSYTISQAIGGSLIPNLPFLPSLKRFSYIY